MAIRNLFYQCVSGPHALTMDCWYLVQRPDQIYWVEHTWSHGDGPDDPDVGSCTLPVGQFVCVRWQYRASLSVRGDGQWGTANRRHM